MQCGTTGCGDINANNSVMMALMSPTPAVMIGLHATCSCVVLCDAIHCQCQGAQINHYFSAAYWIIIKGYTFTMNFTDSALWTTTFAHTIVDCGQNYSWRH